MTDSDTPSQNPRLEDALLPAPSVTDEGSAAPGFEAAESVSQPNTGVVPPSPPAQTDTSRRVDGLARMLSLTTLLLLAGLVAATWFFGRAHLLARDVRLAALEAEIARATTDAEQQVMRAAAPLLEQVTQIEQRVDARNDAQGATIANMENAVREQLRRFDERLARTDERISRLTATDRRSWLMQEAEFMVRLANQRLAAARDVPSAISLLRTADDLLLEASDPLFDASRRALAADLASLRALPVIDRVGIDGRLDALLTESDALSLARTVSVSPRDDGEGWLAQAEAGWRAALATLSRYLVVRERSDEIASLLTPNGEVLARQNLRMLLEQAQIAALSGNAVLYERAIDRAMDFAARFRAADRVRVDAMVAELAMLRSMPVGQALPDLLASRRTLRDAARQLGVGAVD